MFGRFDFPGLNSCGAQGPGGQPRYDLAYSGGHWTNTGSGTFQEGGYGGNPGMTVGTGGVLPAVGPGSASCSEEITATFTWNSLGNPANVPPDAVVIKITATASFNGDLGTVSNGLGSPSVQTETGRISTGFVHVVESGSSFTIKRTPTAAVSKIDTGYGGMVGGNCSVSLSFDVYPVNLNISGVIDPKTDLRILVGQRMGAGVSLGDLSYESASYAWEVAGASPFSDYTVGATSATITPFTLPSPQVATIQALFRVPEEVTVSCRVTLAAPNLTIPLSKSFNVVSPAYYHETRSIGIFQFLLNDTPNTVNPNKFRRYLSWAPDLGGLL